MAGIQGKMAQGGWVMPTVSTHLANASAVIGTTLQNRGIALRLTKATACTGHNSHSLRVHAQARARTRT